VPIAWSGLPRPGTPVRLAEIGASFPTGFDVSRDGKRFYVVEFDLESRRTDRIDVVRGWLDDLRRLAK